MGNRMIKETIRTSRSVGDMTDFQFRTWVYLITYVDDYGRGSADPELLKGLVFTRRKGVTEATIEKTLSDLANMGSIRLYEVDGERYFCFPNWSEHQRVQQKRSKYPEPPAFDGNSQKSTVGHGEPPSEPETEPEEETKTEDEGEGEYCAEHGCADSAPPVIALPLNDKTEYLVTDEDLDEWQSLYPAVDVMQELRNMRGWLLSNPSKRKTRNGVKRFVNSWLAREQNKGGSAPAPQRQSRGNGRRDPMDELSALHQQFAQEEGY